MSITIPSSVTSLGNSCFENCWELATITIIRNIFGELLLFLLFKHLTAKKPWHKNVDWIDQLCAIVNLIPSIGGALAGEIRQ